LPNGRKPNARDVLPISVRRRREPVAGRNLLRRGPPAERQPAKRAAFLPDIEFLARHSVPERVLDLATDLAASRGTSPSEELLAAGLDPRLYWSLLAADLGVEFLRSIEGATLPPQAGLVEGEVLRGATSALLRFGDRLILVVAPQPDEIPLFRRRLRENPALAQRVRVAAPATIRAFIAVKQRNVLSRRAVGWLAAAMPSLSARYIGRAKGATGPKTLVAAVLGLVLVAPLATFQAIGLLCTLFFCNCSVWKLAAAFARRPVLRIEPLSSAALPSYTVLVPLYREAAIVSDLMRHLSALDYPALCIKRTKEAPA
jgi:glycosyltransferase XagB